MTNEDLIAELLEKAAPLRLLPDDQAEARGLPALVNQINALRSAPRVVLEEDEVANPRPTEEGADAQEPKKRGRPRKGA